MAASLRRRSKRVGRTISVDSQPRLIAGIMPRGSKVVSYDFDLLVPMAFDPVKQYSRALPTAASHGSARALRFLRRMPIGPAAQRVDGLMVQRPRD